MKLLEIKVIFEKIIKESLVLSKCEIYKNMVLVNREIKILLDELNIINFIKKELKIIKIFSAENMSGAISNNGKVWIWGKFKYGIYNEKDQLTHLSIPLPLKFLKEYDIKNLVLNKNFSLCIDINGNKTYLPKWFNSKVIMNEEIIQIKSKYKHTLYLNNFNKILSMGSNSHGQLGIFSKFSMKPRYIKLLDAVKIISIEVSKNTSFAISENGDVYSFGSNTFGELGQGINIPNSFTPLKIDTLKKIKKIYAGDFHVFAIDENNILFGWGDNNRNQLGLPTSDILYNLDIIYIPYNLNFKYKNILKIAGSCKHTIFLVENNKESLVLSTGIGETGCLGHNICKNTNLKIISELKKKIIIDISAGNKFSMALSNQGEIFVFGENKNFQLGNYKINDLNYINTYMPEELKYLTNFKFKINY